MGGAKNTALNRINSNPTLFRGVSAFSGDPVIGGFASQLQWGGQGMSPDDQEPHRQKRFQLMEQAQKDQDLTDQERKSFLDELTPMGDFSDLSVPTSQRSPIDAGKLEDISKRLSTAIEAGKKRRTAVENDQKRLRETPGRSLGAAPASLINVTTSSASGRSLIS